MALDLIVVYLHRYRRRLENPYWMGRMCWKYIIKNICICMVHYRLNSNYYFLYCFVKCRFLAPALDIKDIHTRFVAWGLMNLANLHSGYWINCFALSDCMAEELLAWRFYLYTSDNRSGELLHLSLSLTEMAFNLQTTFLNVFPYQIHFVFWPA